MSGSPPNRADARSCPSISDAFVPDGALYRFLVDSLTEYAVFAVSPEGHVITWNSGAEQTFGYTQTEIIGRPFSIIFTPEDIEAGAPERELEFALIGNQRDYDRWHVRKDGSRFWGMNTVQTLRDAAGGLLGFTKLVRDFTSVYLAREKLSDSEQRLRLIFESVHDYAIFSIAVDGTVTSWNAGAQKVFGFTASEMMGRNYSALFSAADVVCGVPEKELHEAATNGFVNEERWLVRQDGSAFLASGILRQLQPGPVGELRGFVSVTHDVTERDAVAQDLRRRAQYDELTGLANRRRFYEHLQRAISSMKRRSPNRFAVLFIDVDKFKHVNDEFGHIIADKLLAATARRLEKCVRSEDIVARIGGDEFAILLNGINGVADANDAAHRIGMNMREPVTIDERDVQATVSIGIAMGNHRYDRPEDILRDADTAMYAAKTEGRARSVLFDAAMANGESGNFDLAADLRHAIENDQLRIAYQPVMRLADASIVGFEALVRWQHPRRGLLEPVHFIPKAEDSDLIVLIDRWMLDKACRQLAEWQARGIVGPRLRMSVNVSSKNVSRADFLDNLRESLGSGGLAPTSLRLEITETAIMERSERVNALIAAIRALGVDVDVDDFGTGYSSLGALHDMLVDALKIDSSFVARMNSHNGAELVKTIITLAHNLGMVAIAEGIETPEQLHRLTALGCDFGQGFLFAVPLDAESATRFLTESGNGARI
jgi:diguanylate cyclase (GGDEF)-like protein/PAS domain S-box-containing protein